MNVIRDTANFVKQTRKGAGRGELSREPLTILRIEWRGDLVGCDWLMRSIDPWDKDLPEQLAREQQTVQSLRDGLNLRELIFKSFPAVMSADLRMYRADRNHQLELMMIGKLNRLDQTFHRVSSLAMRAKLCGFQFQLSNGVLDGPIQR